MAITQLSKNRYNKQVQQLIKLCDRRKIVSYVALENILVRQRSKVTS